MARRLVVLAVLALGCGLPTEIGPAGWSSTAELVAAFGPPCAVEGISEPLWATICASLARQGQPQPARCSGDRSASEAAWVYRVRARRVDCDTPAPDEIDRLVVLNDVPCVIVVQR